MTSTSWIDPTPILELLELLEVDDRTAGERIGVSAKTIQRWRAGTARIRSMWTADRAACALGRHPGELWPTYHDWLPVAAPSLFDDDLDVELDDAA